MLFWPSRISKHYLAALVVLLCISSHAISLDELRSSTDLTPKKFVSYFRDFEFKFRGEIQPAEVFLTSRSGDCDDFSILAAAVLREKGYTPRLIAVRMPGVTHVVCYVEETGSYLDYNLRGKREPLVKSVNSLDSIAANVARSYGLRWTSVSEFTYQGGVKCLVQTVVEPQKNTKIIASLFSF
jgi:hypothetical protein